MKGENTDAEAVASAMEEVESSDYSRGFMDGWDMRNQPAIPLSEEYQQGYADGLEVIKHFIPVPTWNECITR